MLNDKALVYLALFGPEQIDDIVSFVRTHGSNAKHVVASARKKDMLPPPALNELDCELAEAVDVRSMAHAITLILFDSFNHDWAEADYAKLLVSSLGIAETQAAKMATKIDTEDVFSWGKADLTDKMKRIYNFLVPSAIEAEYNSKAMDKDYKYELKNFGDAITEIIKSTGFSKPRTFTSLTPGEAYAMQKGDITPSLLNKISLSRAAMRYAADPFYGDVFSSILGGLKGIAATMPPGSFVEGAANLASAIKAATTQGQISADASRLAAKNPVQAEFYPIQPASQNANQASAQANAIPLVFLTKDGFGNKA